MRVDMMTEFKVVDRPARDFSLHNLNEWEKQRETVGLLPWQGKQSCRCPSNKQAVTPRDLRLSPPANWLVIIDKPNGSLIYVKIVVSRQPPGIKLGVILHCVWVFWGIVVEVLLSPSEGTPGMCGQRYWCQRRGQNWTAHQSKHIIWVRRWIIDTHGLLKVTSTCLKSFSSSDIYVTFLWRQSGHFGFDRITHCIESHNSLQCLVVWSTTHNKA